MINTGIAASVRSRPPVSLADLQQHAAFLTRKDRKYIVPAGSIEGIVDAIDPEASVLELNGQRVFRYETAYFDTDDRLAYVRALRKRPNRFKVRTRLYTDSKLCLLEVKVCNARGETVKQRIGHDGRSQYALDGEERRWLSRFPQIGNHTEQLDHCITNTYERATLMLPQGAGRVTIDQSLRFFSPDGCSLSVADYVIVETKGSGRPTSVDRLLWLRGIRPVSVSKFAIGVSLLEPELPRNRWCRVLDMLAENASFMKSANHREVRSASAERTSETGSCSVSMCGP